MSNSNDKQQPKYKKTLCPKCGNEPDGTRFSSASAAYSSCSRCSTRWSPVVVQVTNEDPSFTITEVAQQVFDTEGFFIQLTKKEHTDLAKCNSCCQYSYKKAAYGTWTVKKWKETRMGGFLDDFNVEVLEFDGTPVAGNKTLKKLRDHYPSMSLTSRVTPKATSISTEPDSNQAKRIEKEMYPKLRRDNPSSVPSIEIAVDYVPDEYKGECFDLLLNLVQNWIDDNSFVKEAVIWQWCCSPTTDYMHLWGPVFSEFICMIGLPKACRDYVASKLKVELGNAVKYPADALGSDELEDALSLAYINDGIVWQSLDPCTWLSVKKMEN